MSYVATYNAFQIQTLSKAEQHILSGICTFADRNTGICWPTVETIASRCRSSVRTVQTHINALVSKGLLQRIYRPNRPAITKVLIPLTHTLPAISAPLEVQILRGEPAIDPINQRAAPPATPEPGTAAPAAMPLLCLESKIPQTEPQHAIQEIESLPDYSAQLQVFANSQYAPTEATETTYSASNEADKAIHTLDPATPVVERQAEGTQGQAVDAIEADPKPTTIDTTQAEADQADPAMAAWAEVPAQVIADLQAIRLEKRKKKVPTKTEIQSWYSIALAEGWTLPQLAYALVLKNWSRVEPGWLQHVPRPQMTATGAPAAPTAPALWTPDQNHIPASPATVATWREKIAQMKQRWREEPLKARPMRQ